MATTGLQEAELALSKLASLLHDSKMYIEAATERIALLETVASIATRYVSMHGRSEQIETLKQLAAALAALIAHDDKLRRGV